MVKKGFYCVFCALVAIFFTACKEDVGTLNVPGNLGENYSLAFVDSITIRKSTVLLDSIPTSNTETLLVGKYVDNKLGIIESTPYFQVGLGDPSWSISDKDVYDSMVLILDYTKYYYGDTTVALTIEVRRLTEDLQTYQLSKFWYDIGLYSFFDNNFFSGPNGTTLLKKNIYNSKNFSADESSILGKRTFLPRPQYRRVNYTNKDTLAVRLDDNLGMEFFQKKKEFSIDMTPPSSTTNSGFLNYFKGLTIRCLSGASVVGLTTTTGVIRMYYHENSGQTLPKKVHNFFLIDNNHYNHITADRTGTLIENLSTKPELPSTLTGNETYIQSGLGIVTKLSFPGLFNLASLPGFKQVTRAQLVIEPIKKSYNDNFYLPDELILFNTNKTNLPLSTIGVDFGSGVQFATVKTDPEDVLAPSYTFNLTQYIQALSKSNANPTEFSLLVSTSPSISSARTGNLSNLRNSMLKTTTRAVLNANYRTRLEIYYLKNKLN